MRQTLLDRAISVMAPRAGLARVRARLALEAFAAQRALMESNAPSVSASLAVTDGSAGGTSPLLRRWFTRSRDAAGDTLPYLFGQRAQIRELARTNPLASGAIDTNVNRVVGTGLAVVPRPNLQVLGWDPKRALEWGQQAQTEFSLWADSTECDYHGEQTFYEKQGLTLRAALESGDTFTNMPDGDASDTQPYRLRLQTLEADRVGNPGGVADTVEVCGGVSRRQDGSAAATSFYVYDVHPGTILIGAKSRYQGQWIDRVGKSGRRRILHHFRQLRPEQPRGVPYLAPVIDCLKQLGRYTEAEIQAAVVSAFFTVFIETAGGSPSPAPVFGGTQEQVAADPEIALGPGVVLGLAKNEKATFADPGRPNPAFDPFVQAILKQIGVGLGLPYELLVKQFNSSYSASRAALLDAWLWFRTLRAWLATSFCQPVYETWMAEAVILGRISAPGFFRDPLMRWAYTRAEWHGDSQGSINPKDEVEAYAKAVDARFMTRERAEWELFGSDWYATFPSKVNEQEMLKEADLLPTPQAGAPAPNEPPAPPVNPASE